jgi:hypothetical protein
MRSRDAKGSVILRRPTAQSVDASLSSNVVPVWETQNAAPLGFRAFLFFSATLPHGVIVPRGKLLRALWEDKSCGAHSAKQDGGR